METYKEQCNQIRTAISLLEAQEKEEQQTKETIENIRKQKEEFLSLLYDIEEVIKLSEETNEKDVEEITKREEEDEFEEVSDGYESEDIFGDSNEPKKRKMIKRRKITQVTDTLPQQKPEEVVQDDSIVDVEGKNVPEPISSFKKLFDGVLIDNINRAGFLFPTLVQQYAIPIIDTKRDLIAIAKTGNEDKAG